MAAARSVLVLGGQRSGKSRYAEGLVMESGRTPVYVATATAGDGEMAARIARHRERRNGAWRTIEEPLDLPAALARHATAKNAVLVECLTLWLSNLMEAGRDIGGETGHLLDALAAPAGPLVLVSNEVGSGIIPGTPLARSYADALGTLNQRVAAATDRVVLVAAGLPLLLKPQRQMEIAL